MDLVGNGGSSDRAAIAAGRRVVRGREMVKYTRGLMEVLLAVVFLLIPGGGATAQAGSPLDLRVGDCLQWSGVWKSITLVDALGELGSCVEGGYVLFGLEDVMRGGAEPRIVIAKLDIKEGMTVGAALKEILVQLPPYAVVAKSDHLVALRPSGAEHDASDLLNLPVPAFDVSDTDAYAVLGFPRHFIPALETALTPKPEPGKRLLTIYAGGGYYPPGPRVTLHLRNVTVFDVLNAAAAASEVAARDGKPSGWLYAYDPGQPLDSGRRHSWRLLYSLPRDWNYKHSKEHATPRP
jgi:hypothetical protein